MAAGGGVISAAAPAASPSPAATATTGPGRWIWGRNIDVGVFVGSTVVALGLAALAPWLAPDGDTPMWAWLVFVLGLDVAHVWTTLFRTYLDPEERARRPLLYFGVPVVAYAAGVAIYAQGALVFWRALAYAAAFHFVRQQLGWVAIYRARAGERSVWDRRIDNALVYLATGWPLLYWHTHGRAFSWFVDGDFIDLSAARAWVIPVGGLYAMMVVLYVGRAWRHVRAGRPHNVGKHLAVGSTAAIWGLGIVAFDDDFAFTVTNVTAHAVPYFVLLWFYTKERGAERPRSRIASVARAGAGCFVLIVLGLAFAEEQLWERLVWHDRPGWFGGASRDTPLLGALALTLVVPLLALPQVVHYVLDGVLWRGREGGPAQARALGFAPRRTR